MVLLAFVAARTDDQSIALVEDIPQPIFSAPFEVDDRAAAIERARPDAVERGWAKYAVAQGLVSPDSLAIHPRSGMVLVSEEDAHAVTRVDNGERLITQQTPIFYTDLPGEVRAQPLRFPEGIAFDSAGNLYVVEDTPGGRLIRFAEVDGSYPRGEVVPVPGGWNEYAWEGVDVGPGGELLLAGSDLESVARESVMTVFSGAILYRDADGNWWVPYRRFFASFSDVKFSNTGKQAIYTCEVTGEVGWLDLSVRLTRGGQSRWSARSPEGVALLPDGTLVIAEERGELTHLDPSSDMRRTIFSGLSSIEGVVWDPVREALLVAEDGTGRVLALRPDVAFDPRVDMMLYAAYYPAFSQENIPAECPPYLARILRYGGLQFDGARGMDFREFVRRVPIVAADLRAVSMNPDRVIEDPVERVQFAVFQPNRMERPGSGAGGIAFSIFGVRMASGEYLTTSTLPMDIYSASAPLTVLDKELPGALSVPAAGGVSVSGIGVAAIQFLGMGLKPDFSLVLNPRNPVDSYMVVFHRDGRRDHYRLESSHGDVRDSWVIGYRSIQRDAWIPIQHNQTPTAELAQMDPK